MCGNKAGGRPTARTSPYEADYFLIIEEWIVWALFYNRTGTLYINVFCFDRWEPSGV